MAGPARPLRGLTGHRKSRSLALCTRGFGCRFAWPDHCPGWAPGVLADSTPGGGLWKRRRELASAWR